MGSELGGRCLRSAATAGTMCSCPTAVLVPGSLPYNLNIHPFVISVDAQIQPVEARRSSGNLDRRIMAVIGPPLRVPAVDPVQ